MREFDRNLKSRNTSLPEVEIQKKLLDSKGVASSITESMTYKVKSRRESATMSSRSMLLELPPEIRNRIYELLVVVEGSVFVTKIRIRPSPPPLLAVNRQIRHEAIGMYFGLNVFHNAAGLVRWLKSLDDGERVKLCRVSWGWCSAVEVTSPEMLKKRIADLEKLLAALLDMHAPLTSKVLGYEKTGAGTTRERFVSLAEMRQIKSTMSI